MTGSIFVVSQSGSHVSNVSFNIFLWHLLLGHMSEKSLDIPSKQGLLKITRWNLFNFLSTVSIESNIG